MGTLPLQMQRSPRRISWAFQSIPLWRIPPFHLRLQLQLAILGTGAPPQVLAVHVRQQTALQGRTIPYRHLAVTRCSHLAPPASTEETSSWGKPGWNQRVKPGSTKEHLFKEAAAMPPSMPATPNTLLVVFRLQAEDTTLPGRS